MPTTASAAATPPAAFLLLHGAATTGAVWAGVRRGLGERPVLAPDRPSAGDLDAELAALRGAIDEASRAAALSRSAGAALPPGPGTSVRPGAGAAARPGAGAAARPGAGAALSPGADLAPSGPARPVVFGGVSGGATLGLAALAAGFPLAAAVLHEPAVGSLLPGLLAPMAAAFAEGGVAAFGRALYGPTWRPSDAAADPDAVARDLAMFLRFEPAAPGPTPGPVVITVGERSPETRYRAAEALHRELGLPVRVLEGCGHAAHLEAPDQFAAVLLEVAAALP